jgi:beta-lactam-binding protein with PASTA domain
MDDGHIEPTEKKPPVPLWIWIASAAAVVALVAVGFWLFAGGGAIEVPDVVGENQAAATQMLQTAGLKLGEVTEEATDAPAGTVIAQEPLAGEKADEGSAVNLILSSGPAKIAVPDLSGMTGDEAEKALREVGLKATTTAEYDASIAKDSVIDQLPAAGEQVVEGSVVGVLLSLGARPTAPIAVPSVKGQTRAQARATLNFAGLNALFVTTNSSTVASGTAIEQTPLAGVKVAPDTEVLVLLSSGPAPAAATIAVPKVIGKTSAAAQTALGSAGLRGVSYKTYSTRPKGEVVGQEPAAGAQVISGTVVGMLVSAGPRPTTPPVNPPTYPTPPVNPPTYPTPPIEKPAPPQLPEVETVKVPEVTGMTEAEATVALNELGLYAFVVSYASDDVPKGEVIKQLPVAGKYVVSGYTVMITVSSGPDLEPPPDELPSEEPSTP